jgi:hypothetical protein
VKQAPANRNVPKFHGTIFRQWLQHAKQTKPQSVAIVEGELSRRIEPTETATKGQADRVDRVVILVPSFPGREVDPVGATDCLEHLVQFVLSPAAMPVEISIGYRQFHAEEVDVLLPDAEGLQDAATFPLSSLLHGLALSAAGEIGHDDALAPRDAPFNFREYGELIVRVGEEKKPRI